VAAPVAACACPEGIYKRLVGIGISTCDSTYTTSQAALERVRGEPLTELGRRKLGRGTGIGKERVLVVGSIRNLLLRRQFRTVWHSFDTLYVHMRINHSCGIEAVDGIV
jgi:hypothetical protein